MYQPNLGPSLANLLEPSASQQPPVISAAHFKNQPAAALADLSARASPFDYRDRKLALRLGTVQSHFETTLSVLYIPSLPTVDPDASNPTITLRFQAQGGGPLILCEVPTVYRLLLLRESLDHLSPPRPGPIHTSASPLV